jgi:DNA modification methylase
MKTLPDNCLDLAIVDPPYFRILKNEKWDKFKNYHQYKEWSTSYLNEMVSKIRLNGTLLIYGCSRNINVLATLSNILEECGMEFVQEVIIDKGMKSVAGRTSKNIKMLPPVSENILVFRKDAKPTIKQILKAKQQEYGFSSSEMNALLGCKSNGGGNWTKYTGDTEFPLFPTEDHWETLVNIFKIKIPYRYIRVCYNPIFGLTNVWNDIDFFIKGRKHPSEKPVKLAERCLNIFSNNGDSVFIPFAGSGSEIEACMLTNRQWIASEISSDYVEDIIMPRISQIHNNKY